MPTLREFLDPVIQEMDPEQGIEEQYKVSFHVACVPIKDLTFSFKLAQSNYWIIKYAVYISLPSLPKLIHWAQKALDFKDLNPCLLS